MPNSTGQPHYLPFLLTDVKRGDSGVGMNSVLTNMALSKVLHSDDPLKVHLRSTWALHSFSPSSLKLLLTEYICLITPDVFLSGPSVIYLIPLLKIKIYFCKLMLLWVIKVQSVQEKKNNNHQSELRENKQTKKKPQQHSSSYFYLLGWTNYPWIIVLSMLCIQCRSHQFQYFNVVQLKNGPTAWKAAFCTATA